MMSDFAKGRIAIVEVPQERLRDVIALRAASGRELGETAVDAIGWDARFLAYLRERCGADELRAFAALDGDRYVGMALASIDMTYRFATFDQRDGHINAVYVDPKHRNNGLGRALALAAVAWLTSQRCSVVRLRPTAAAQSLYRSIGFEPCCELELRLRADVMTP